ncbi:MAG: Verru_Chthon cassette protein C [Candidatus Methylacidiphilales bacterium]|nr:Verru_Chthon cassette protein C [Candidatus Methylacidiphilales bacterium]
MPIASCLAPPFCRKRRTSRAFSLIELMAAVTVLSGILIVVFGITQQVSTVWRNSAAKIESFRGARNAFSALSRQLEQATLNTYYDYYQNGTPRTAANASTFVPTSYGRASELHFIAGKSLVPGQVSHSIFFAAPLGRTDVSAYQGMEALLNATGFYLTYGPDLSRPAFLDALPNAAATRRNRFRLMQFLQPSQNLGIYAYTSNADKNRWFADSIAAGRGTQQVAENIIALVILPRLSTGESAAPGSLAPDYEYDTRNASNLETFHQMPPVLEVVMVAIDEPSAARLGNSVTAPELGLSSLFREASDLESDLKKLTTTLDSKRITYRVFRTGIAIKGAKWSS